MTESEQAQAIHEIDSRLKHPWVHDVGQFINDCEYLRDLVDSQAQKIISLKISATDALEKQAQKIAEQAKEIERLKQRIQGECVAKAGF